MLVLDVIFLIIGIVIGTRIGLRGLFMFWAVIGLIYLLIKVPLLAHGFILDRLAGHGGVKAASAVVLILAIIGLVWGVMQLGAALYDKLELDVLPEGVDRAFGGALGGALGWILVELIL